MANTPILQTIPLMPSIQEIVGDLLFEVASETEGSAKVTLDEIKEYVNEGALTEEAADERYILAEEGISFEDVKEKPTYLAAGETAAAARDAIGAGTSNLTIGTTGDTAAAGNDSRITGAVQESTRNQANGFAGLDSAGLIPSSILPSYVDDVLEFDDLEDFPEEGESGKIYVATTTNVTYRWGGSIYVRMGSGDVISVNGRTGNVTGLAEQAQVTADMNDRYTKTESDVRYIKKSDGIAMADISDLPTVLAAGATQAAARSVIDVYSKSETTLAAADVVATALADYYGKTEADDRYYQKSNVYTKTEADGRYYQKSESYSKTEVNNLFSNLGSTLTWYSLPVVTTTGVINVGTGNIYKMAATSARTVTFTGIPSGRAVVVVILITGNSTVTWPGGITWVDDQTPVLGTSWTPINLFFIDGKIIGSVQKAV